MAASSTPVSKSNNPTTLRDALIEEFGSKAKKPLKISDEELTQLFVEADDLNQGSSEARIQSRKKARQARLRIILACPRISAIREAHIEAGTTEKWYKTQPFGRKKGMVSLLASIGDELREAARRTRKPMFTAVNMDLLNGSLKTIDVALREANGKKVESRVSKARNLKGIKARVEQIGKLAEPFPKERAKVAISMLGALGLDPMSANGLDVRVWRQTQRFLLNCLHLLPDDDQADAAATLIKAGAAVEAALEPRPSPLRDPHTLSEVVGNEEAVAKLKAQVKAGGSPAILIMGDSRSGKTAMATAFAREWSKLHNNSFSSKPYELLGAGVGSKKAAAKIRDWAKNSGGVLNPVLIVNECEELLVEQRQILDLLETQGKGLPAPLILCTTKSEQDMHRTLKDTPLLDPQLLGRMTLIIQTEPLGDEQIGARINLVAQEEGYQLSQDDLDSIIATANGRLGLALQELNSVLVGDK